MCQNSLEQKKSKKAVFYSPPQVPMECSWSAHGVYISPHGVHGDSSWSPRGVSMDSVDSMSTPPKIHRFYGESMDFGWTMISFGEIYPCRSVIVSTFHFLLLTTLLQVNAIIPSNKYILHFAVIYLQTQILFFLILAELLKSVIHNEKLLLFN